MEILFFWLSTVIASYGINLANGLQVFKDVADAGYKISVEKMMKLKDQILPEDFTKVSLLEMLIPIYNLMQAFKKTMEYSNIRPMVLDELSILDSLEEMSESEKEEYLKKPSMLNALIVNLKSEIRLKNATLLVVGDKNSHSDIYFDIDDNTSKINILKVTGPASKLTVEEQKKLIIDNSIALCKELKKIKTTSNTADKENITNEKASENIDFSKLQSIKAKKDEVIKLRDEVLEKQEELNSNQNNQEHTLKRKK